MESIIKKLRDLDAYPKINEDFYKRTFSGGIITILAAFIMSLLFFSEFRSYLHTVKETTLLVDTSRGGTLRINFDITFPAVPCTILSLDAEDISGERHFDIRHDITKKRIDVHGNEIEARKDGIGAPKIEKPLQRHGGRLEHNETYCGSCYGAETADDHCCNSCEEVREAYRKKGWALSNMDMIDQCEREGFFQKIDEEKGEGCNINGFLEVNKVAGTFHFVPGKTFHQSGFHFNDLIAFQKNNYNITHKINKLSFGEYFPGIVNPLDGVQWLQDSTSGMYQYFVKVVPTVYTDVRGRTIQSNQFSVTEHLRNLDSGHNQIIPGIFFFYDLSPVKVTFMETGISFLHFMTNVCAIVGGTFTVAGITDSFVFHGRKVVKKKILKKFG
ncbi:uncharacterized protein LOC141599496 [Silene latifolia]|uniref:uncharacterized protein LOC141599496 n=1 Tax=Silene latifolia TaxID=37657 RepID=UPI003D770D80